MVCGQGCGLWDSLIPPKSLNRPVILNNTLMWDANAWLVILIFYPCFQILLSLRGTLCF